VNALSGRVPEFVVNAEVHGASAGSLPVRNAAAMSGKLRRAACACAFAAYATSTLAFDLEGHRGTRGLAPEKHDRRVPSVPWRSA